MGMGGMLLKASQEKCPFCKEHVLFGDHSKKNSIRCLLTATVNMHKALEEIGQLRKFIEERIKEEEAELKAKEQTSETPTEEKHEG